MDSYIDILPKNMVYNILSYLSYDDLELKNDVIIKDRYSYNELYETLLSLKYNKYYIKLNKVFNNRFSPKRNAISWKLLYQDISKGQSELLNILKIKKEFPVTMMRKYSMDQYKILILTLDHGPFESIVDHNLVTMTMNKNIAIYWERIHRNNNGNITNLGLEDYFLTSLFYLGMFYPSFYDNEMYEVAYRGVGHKLTTEQKTLQARISIQAQMTATAAMAVYNLKSITDQLNPNIINVLNQLDTSKLVKERHNLDYILTFGEKLIVLLNELIIILRQNSSYTSVIDFNDLLTRFNKVKLLKNFDSRKDNVLQIKHILRIARDKSNALYIISNIGKINSKRIMITVGGAHLHNLSQYLKEFNIEVIGYKEWMSRPIEDANLILEEVINKLLY